MRPVSIQKIRSVAQKLGRRFRPEKIILFGSYAYGRPHADSDVDLFLVMRSHRHPIDQAVEVYKQLHPRPFPVDIMVRTPQEVRHRLALGDSFIEEIMTRGKVIYEA